MSETKERVLVVNQPGRLPGLLPRLLRLLTNTGRRRMKTVQLKDRIAHIVRTPSDAEKLERPENGPEPEWHIFGSPQHVRCANLSPGRILTTFAATCAAASIRLPSRSRARSAAKAPSGPFRNGRDKTRNGRPFAGDQQAYG